MTRATLNISMPQPLRLFVEGKVAGGGYGSASEYIRELIRMDQRLELVQKAGVNRGGRPQGSISLRKGIHDWKYGHGKK